MRVNGMDLVMTASVESRRDADNGDTAKNPKILMTAEERRTQEIRPLFFFKEAPSTKAFHHAPGACKIVKEALPPPDLAIRANGSVRLTSSSSMDVS